MGWILQLLLHAASAGLFAVALTFSAECFLGMLPLRSPTGRRKERRAALRKEGPRIAVLVPAHDEQPVLARTLATIRAQLQRGDRLVVVADNCTDDTAAVARASGAEVVERFEPERRGKGFALAFGVRWIAADPPEVLVIIDADCQIAPGCLSALASSVVATGRPAQAEYLLRTPASSPLQSMNALAFLVRNQVRLRGLHRIGGPSQLTGSGMAFPFSLTPMMGLLGANIVEDLTLGVELAYRGHAPVLCPDARVEGQLPTHGGAAHGQRRRWEHGQLRTLLTHGPRLLIRGMGRADYQALLLGLDLMVPPLSLFVLVELVVFSALAATHLALPIPVALGLTGGALGLVAVSVALAWFRFGRATVPLRHLLAAPFYIAWKVPIYAAFLLRRAEAQWVRTRRDAEGPPA